MVNTPRELAYKTLLSAEKDTSRSIDDLLGSALGYSTLTPPEKRWVMELVYGVTRLKLQLDGWINHAYKGRYKKAQHAIKVLLRMGTFQLKYMHTSEHAAINESVELCKRVKQPQATNMVNAILRKLQGLTLQEILSPIKEDLKRLSIKTSHPEWMLERWLDRYTLEDVIQFCQRNNTPPNTWIRRNRLIVSQTDFEAFLEEEEIKYKQSELLASFYDVENSGKLLASEAFRSGWFSYQDMAAGVVASLVEPQPNETIVDACAAPGGKMAFLCELSGGAAHIKACDASSSRLTRVTQNIQRLALPDIEVIQMDAAIDKLPEADKILLDVPCSGTGVLNRRPDARWKRQPGDTDSLVDIQTKIFKNSWNALKPGGLMVYATCTLEPEENWEVIDSVLSQIEHGAIEAIGEEKLKPYIDERGALSTLPWEHGMDGMFAVKIRKKV